MRDLLTGTILGTLGLLVVTPALAVPVGPDAATDIDGPWSVSISAIAHQAPAIHPFDGFAGIPRPAGFLAADPIPTDWRVLLGLNYQTGAVSAALKDREGRIVSIPGFMVPFEDGMTGVDEFLLVPYFGACIHTPPPPPNQMVYVRMEGGAKVDVNIWDAVVIEGVLDVASIDSPYGSVGHQVLGQRLRPYVGNR
ncbi:MAG: DUF3299 domain-containing protein [Gemmatimonadales bacterium]|nr:MAG: DUF3299 domain-containing protein [Gemmatimonadales bacterium]